MKRAFSISALGTISVLAFVASVDAQYRPRLSPEKVHKLAVTTTIYEDLNADPCMLTAIALVESGDIENISAGVDPVAVRKEPDGRESTGMMQTLVSTAQWLAGDMGYSNYGVSIDRNDLFIPRVSMYFAAAYMDYLNSYGNVSEAWLVQSYNQGPGNAAPAYLRKYRQAKSQLIQEGICQ